MCLSCCVSVYVNACVSAVLCVCVYLCVCMCVMCFVVACVSVCSLYVCLYVYMCVCGMETVRGEVHSDQSVHVYGYQIEIVVYHKNTHSSQCNVYGRRGHNDM